MGVEDKASNPSRTPRARSRRGTGKATDNEELENEGKADRAEASVKESVEHLKDAAGNVKDAFKK